MNIANLAPPETFRKLTEEMERTSTRGLHETALRLVFPESSVLAQTAALFVIPKHTCTKMLEPRRLSL